MKAHPIRCRQARFLFAKLVILALFAFPVSATPSWAKSDAEVRDAIEDILVDRHPKDTPEWWRSLGANAPGVIISIYEGTGHTYRRLKLLQGLGSFDTPEAIEFLKKQAETTPDDVVRNTAIRSVGAAAGAREEEFLAKYLAHEDPQTRFAAAETLRKLNDPRANAIVDKYLKNEKVPWIEGKLRGELPRPTARLTPVASSEDRLNPDFAGQWKGFWLAPKGPKEEGMTSDPVAVSVQVESATELKGEVVVRVKKENRTYKLSRISGKGSKIAGSLVEQLLPPQPGVTPARPRASEPFPFEAELRQEAESYFIQFRLPRNGVTVVARKPMPSSR